MNLPCISSYRTGDEFRPGSPSFEPDTDYDERMEQINAARNALDDAEAALDKGRFSVCDGFMADAMSALEAA